MRRKLFNIVAALSLVAPIVILLLFPLGKSRFAGWSTGRHQLVGKWYYQIFDSADVGCIGLSVYHDWPTPDIGPPLAPNLNWTPEALTWYDRLPTGCHIRKLGFGYDHDTYFERNATPSMIAMGRYMSVGIPFWAAAAVWLMPVPFAFLIWRRVVANGRIKRGLCIVCGYDLRATPNQCPECGAAPKPTNNQDTSIRAHPVGLQRTAARQRQLRRV
jgi:hypothetical protein